jgi:hypothetical protein
VSPLMRTSDTLSVSAGVSLHFLRRCGKVVRQRSGCSGCWPLRIATRVLLYSWTITFYKSSAAYLFYIYMNIKDTKEILLYIIGTHTCCAAHR